MVTEQPKSIGKQLLSCLSYAWLRMSQENDEQSIHSCKPTLIAIYQELKQARTVAPDPSPDRKCSWSPNPPSYEVVE